MPQSAYNLHNMATLEYASQLINYPFPFIKTRQLRQLFNIHSKRTLQNVIKNLLKHKLLIQLEKGKYLIAAQENNITTFDIAYFVYSPSYISLETALNYYGILPQFPFSITSVTTRKTKEKEILEFSFEYHHISVDLFAGYEKHNYHLIATKEKALFDYLYFVLKGIKTKNYLDELDITDISERKFRQYIKELLIDLANPMLELFNEIKKNAKFTAN